jgi:hypothetical protein
VGVGHHREFAGVATHDLEIFIVQELDGIAGGYFKQVPRNAFYLATIAGKAEGDATLALLGHGVVQIENVAIGDEILRIGLRELFVRIEQAYLRQLGSELGSDRVPVGIDDCAAFRSVRTVGHVNILLLLLMVCFEDHDPSLHRKFKGKWQTYYGVKPYHPLFQFLTR